MGALIRRSRETIALPADLLRAIAAEVETLQALGHTWPEIERVISLALRHGSVSLTPRKVA